MLEWLRAEAMKARDPVVQIETITARLHAWIDGAEAQALEAQANRPASSQIFETARSAADRLPHLVLG